MTSTVRIWSKAFAPSADTDPYSIQVERTLWERAFEREGARRKFLRITHPAGLDEWYAPLGQPVESESPGIPSLYLPLWMLDAAKLAGAGEETEAEILDEDTFPEATRIVLRVVDSALYNSDVKEELERVFSALGVLVQHTTLQIPVSALGGYPVEVFVSKTEPANIILCDGEEVALEFEEPVDQVRPPTPIPDLPPVLEAPSPPPLVPIAETHGFRAFQGQGQTLGGGEVPEWRRGLPPPRR